MHFHNGQRNTCCLCYHFTFWMGPKSQRGRGGGKVMRESSRRMVLDVTISGISVAASVNDFL